MTNLNFENRSDSIIMLGKESLDSIVSLDSKKFWLFDKFEVWLMDIGVAEVVVNFITLIFAIVSIGVIVWVANITIVKRLRQWLRGKTQKLKRFPYIDDFLFKHHFFKHFFSFDSYFNNYVFDSVIVFGF